MKWIADMRGGVRGGAMLVNFFIFRLVSGVCTFIFRDTLYYK